MAGVQGGLWLIGSYVRFFAESASGQLYLTTWEGKVLRFQGDGFEELPPPPGDPLLGFVPYLDDQDVLWEVNPKFIGKFVNGRWQEVIAAEALLKHEQGGTPPWIMAGRSRDGGLWTATSQHLRKYRAGDLVFETRPPWPMPGLWSLTEDSEGNVWICSWNSGLFRFSPDGKWRHFTTQSGLSHYFVRFVFLDREGNWWLGTSSGGLERFKRRKFMNWGLAEGLPGQSIKSVANDGNGGIIIGLMGEGVARLEGTRISQLVRPGETKGTSTFAFSTLVDHKGRLWVGTLKDGLFVVDHVLGQDAALGRRRPRPIQAAQGTIYGLFEDSHENIWVGTDGGAIRFDEKQFKSYRMEGAPRMGSIRCFAEDPQGETLWACSQGTGLYRLAGEQFVRVREAQELASEPVTALLVEKDGTLWMGTENTGLACLRNGRLTRISEKQGLPGRSIASILDDGLGYFWFGSNRGILRISRSDLEAVIGGKKSEVAFQVFSRSDGLASVQSSNGYGQPAAVKDPAGKLWFASFRGVVAVDPRNLMVAPQPAPLVIEEVDVDGQPVSAREQFMTTSSVPPLSVTVSPGAHRLELHYAGLSLTAPEKLRFRYMVEGLDKTWIDLADRRAVYLQDLKPGRYRFRVESSNNGSPWSETSAFAELYWKPHFYQTLWFLGLSVLGVVFAGMSAFRLRLRRVRVRELQLEKLVDQRTAELKGEVEERKRAESALSQARDQLEDRVFERTLELAATNKALEADVRERQRVEEELRRSEDKFAKAFHSSPAAMSITSLDTGQVIDVNDGSVNLFGFSREEVIGRTAAELHTWTDSPVRETVVARLREHGPIRNLEARFKTKTGKLFDALFSAEMITFGGSECLLAVTLDVTELKRLEEQLRQSQKMDALGQLAGSVAHDFNNLLEVIMGYGEILANTNELGAPQKAQLAEVQKAAERAAALTRQLLAFSRKQMLQATVLDLNGIVAEVEKLLRRVIGGKIELTTKMDSSLGRMRADRGQIEQVILNLSVNARDAMPAGGKLTIETANVELDEAYARTRADATPGSYVMLAVSDTGKGMDAATRARIFEPFFTTKERGKGTGLGLSTVYGIVKQSGGHIWLYSEPGRGTTFKIYFPRVAQAASLAEPVRAASNLSGSSETVLVVEDEEAVRKLECEALERCGYRVLQAQSAEQALALSQEHREPIDILVTDMVMPGKGGHELACELLRSRPDLRILYLSGYTENQVVLLEGQNSAAFLQKPFTLITLARKVRQLLDAETGKGRASFARK